MKVSFFAIKLGVLFSIFLLSACSNGKIVKTYDGDALAKAQVAVLTAPENIALISVNGERVKKYLLSNIDVNYGLKPGENIVVFQYESVWSKAAPGDEDAPRSEQVTSEAKEVLINAKPGQQLNFKFKRAENIREAKLIATAFEAEVIDQQSNTIAVSAPAGTYEKSKVKQLVAAEPQLAAVLPDAGDNLTVLAALKALWESASADEKKTFLVWAFQK